MRAQNLPPMLLALAAASVALPAAAESEVDVAPDWLRRPTPMQLHAVWPVAAQEKGVGGEAVIGCKLNTLGALFDCIVLHEKPEGLGFGVAALALTPQMAFKPAMKDGKAVVYDGVRIPVKFSGTPPRPSRGAINELPPTRVATDVRWSDGPSFADVVAAYPAKARAEKVAGHAALECRFTKEGRVRSCGTMSEQPKGYGFAAAAKSLVDKFQGPTRWSDGKSMAGARVDLKFAFSPDMLDPQADPITGKPLWLSLPTAEQLVATLPQAASQAGIRQARVMLSCRVLAQGRVGDCQSLSEDPPGHGVGEAALALAEHFSLAAWSAEGLPTIGGRVRIPLRYDFGSGEPDAPPPEAP